MLPIVLLECVPECVSCCADVKVVVSFFTVAATLSTQFGVVWPSSFVRALDAFSVLSFDIGVISGIFCLLEMSFYEVSW